jgi:hypothetical protein
MMIANNATSENCKKKKKHITDFGNVLCKKRDPNSSDFNSFELPDFYNRFEQVNQNIKRFLSSQM